MVVEDLLIVLMVYCLPFIHLREAHLDGERMCGISTDDGIFEIAGCLIEYAGGAEAGVPDVPLCIDPQGRTLRARAETRDHLGNRETLVNTTLDGGADVSVFCAVGRVEHHGTSTASCEITVGEGYVGLAHHISGDFWRILDVDF